MASIQEAIASKHSTCASVKPRKGFLKTNSRHNDSSPKYSDKVHNLPQRWSRLAMGLRDMGKWTPMQKQDTEEQMSMLIRDSFVLLLHVDWQKDVTAAMITHLTQQINQCKDRYKNINELLVSQCSAIVGLLNDPWGKPNSTLRRLIQGEPCDESAVCEFLKADQHVLKLRIHTLCENKAPDLAQRLAGVVWKYHQLKSGPLSDYRDGEIQYIADLYIVLLAKLNKHKDVYSQMKELTLSQGLCTIQRLRAFQNHPPDNYKVWKKSYKAAEIVVQFFAYRAMREHGDASENSDSYNLMLEWVDIFSPSQEFLDLIEKISSQAASPHHIFTMCRALTAKPSPRSHQKCIAMYIKGLTVEMNHLEQLRGTDDVEAIHISEAELSRGFLQLANLLSSSITDSRECVLTAFSLNPSALCLDRVTEMAKLSGKLKTEVIDTGQPMDVATCDTSNLETRPPADSLQLPQSLCDDLAAVLHCPRFRALSWELEWTDLKERCENYVKERESGESRVVKELKYLNIDYDKWKHLPSREDENHDGIEKGYELEMETGSFDENYDEDEFSLDFTTSASEAGSDASYTMKKCKRSEPLDSRRKKSRPRRTPKRSYVSSDDSRGKCLVDNAPGKKLKCQRKPKGKTPKSDSKRNGKSSVVQLHVSSGRERNISSSDGIHCNAQNNNTNHTNYSNLNVPEDLRNILNKEMREPRNPKSLQSLRDFRRKTGTSTKDVAQLKPDLGPALNIFSKQKASGVKDPHLFVKRLTSLDMIMPEPQMATVQVVQVQAHGNQPSQSAASGTATAAGNGTAPKQEDTGSADQVNGKASGSETAVTQQAANLVTPKLAAGNSGGVSPALLAQTIRRESPAVAQVQRRTVETSQGWVPVPAPHPQGKMASSQAAVSGAALPQFSQAFGFGRQEARAGSTLKQALLSSEKPKLAASSAAGFGSQAQPAGLGAPTHPPAQTPPSVPGFITPATSTVTPEPTSTANQSLSPLPLPQPQQQPQSQAVQPGFGTPTPQQAGFGTPTPAGLQVGYTPTTVTTPQLLVKAAGTLSATPGLILASTTSQGNNSTTTGTTSSPPTVLAVPTTQSLLVTTAQSTSNITAGTPSTIAGQSVVVLKKSSSVPATGPVSRPNMPALVQRSYNAAGGESQCEEPTTRLTLIPTSTVQMSAALVPMKRSRAKDNSTTTQLVLSKLPSPSPIGTPVGRLPVGSPAPGAAAAAAAAEAEAAAEAAGAPTNVSRPLRQSSPPVKSNSLEAELLEFEAVLQQVTQGKQSSSSSQLKDRQPLPEDDVKPSAPTARAVQTDSVVESPLLPLPQQTPKPLVSIATAPVTVSSSFTQTMPPGPGVLQVQSPSPQNALSPVTTPCPSLQGTPAKKKPKPKIVSSPATATTPSDRGNVKTPSTPIGANANMSNKLNQKTTEDEHTTARILSILRQYDEQLKCAPEINNKPAPRRRNQIQPGASPGKRKKNKGKSNLPELSPSTDDTHTMGSEDSSIASHFADGVLEATPTSPLSAGDDRSAASTATTSGDVTQSTAPVTSFAGVTRSVTVGTPIPKTPGTPPKAPSPPRPPSVPALSPSVSVSAPSRTPTPQPTQEISPVSRAVETTSPQQLQLSQLLQSPPPLQISSANIQADSSRTPSLAPVSSSHLARALQKTPQATQTPLLAKALETPAPIPHLIQTLPRVMVSPQVASQGTQLAQISQVPQVTHVSTQVTQVSTQMSQAPLTAQVPQTSLMSQPLQASPVHQVPQVVDDSSTQLPQVTVTQLQPTLRVTQAPQQLLRVSQATQVQQPTGLLVPQATQTVQHIRLAPAVHATQQTQQLPQLVQTSKHAAQSIQQIQLSPPTQAHQLTRIVQVSQPAALPQAEQTPQLVQISTPQLPQAIQSPPVPQLAQVSSQQLRSPDLEEPITSPSKSIVPVYMVPVSSSSQLPVVVSSAAGVLQLGQLGTLSNMQTAVVVRQLPKHTDGKAPGEVTRDTFLLNVSSRTTQPMFISSIQQLLSASQAVTAIPPLSAATPAATVAQSPTVVTTTSPVFTVANAMESAVLADSTTCADNSTTAAIPLTMSSPAPLVFSTDVSTVTPSSTPSSTPTPIHTPTSTPISTPTSTPSSTPSSTPTPVTPTTPVRGTSSTVMTPVSSPTNLLIASTMTSPVTTNPSPVYSSGVPARPPTLLGLQKLQIQHQQIQQIHHMQLVQQLRMKQQQIQEEEDKQLELQKNQQLRRLIQHQQQHPSQQLSQPAQPAPLSVPPPATHVAPKEDPPQAQAPPQSVHFKTTKPTHLKQLLEQAPQPLPPLQPSIRIHGSPPKLPIPLVPKYDPQLKAKPIHSKQQPVQDQPSDATLEKLLARDMPLQKTVSEKEPSENTVQEKGVLVNVHVESLLSIPRLKDNQLSSSMSPEKASFLRLSPSQKLQKSGIQKHPVQEYMTHQSIKKRSKSSDQKQLLKFSAVRDAASKLPTQKPKISSVKQSPSTAKVVVMQQTPNDKTGKQPLEVPVHVTVPQPPQLSKSSSVQSSLSKGVTSMALDIPTSPLAQSTQLQSLSDSDTCTIMPMNSLEAQSMILSDISQLPDMSEYSPVMPPSPPMIHEQKSAALMQASETFQQDNQILPSSSEPLSSPVFESSLESKTALKTRQRTTPRQRTSSRQNSSGKSEVSPEQAIQLEPVETVPSSTSVLQGISMQQVAPTVQNCSPKKPHRKRTETKPKVDSDPKVVAQHVSDTIMRVSMGADCSTDESFNPNLVNDPNLVKDAYYEGQENIPVEVAVAALCGPMGNAESLFKGALEGDLKKEGVITLLPADPSDNTDEINFTSYKNNLKKIDDDIIIKKEISDIEHSDSLQCTSSDPSQGHSSVVLESCPKEDPLSGQDTPLMKLLKRKTSSFAGSLSEHSRSLSGSEDSSMDKPSTSDIFPEEELSLTLSPSFLEFAQMSPTNSQDAVSASPEPPDRKKRCPVLKSYLPKSQMNAVSETFCASIPKSELEVEEVVRVKTESDVNSDMSSINLNQLNGGTSNTVNESDLSSQILSQGPGIEMYFESASVSSSLQSSPLDRALLNALPQTSIQLSHSPEAKQDQDVTICVPEMSTNHETELPSRSAVNVDEEPWGKEPLYSVCEQSSDVEDDFWGKSLTSDIIDVNTSGMGEVLSATSSGGCASKVVRASVRSSSRRSSTPQRKREAVKRKDISTDSSYKKQPVDKKKRLVSGVDCNEEEESLAKYGSVLRSSMTKAVPSARKDPCKQETLTKDEVSTGVTRRVSSRTHKPVTKFEETQKTSKSSNKPPVKGVAHKKK